ncbi:LysR family transcriptional regulator [Pseudonocardia cypriaca]|uniref:DNA-binding transcriptional LysR family regulator n=1 Tax=Pseudonocardia cypriaca TaxID=882449 RepID=A0A543FPH3_9PSEU|nr:LysR family transcriptional regulator [Pseudonocardia cypriaca]TQM35743.1 DNA-binding transcriptional LysR family regulator [Pseudonocardia cypriaca]
MNVMEPSLMGLRVLREVAERGSFTAAAAELGYTQSAVSRQVAALERAAGLKLFDRRPGGVALTAAGLTLLRHAAVALDAVAAAERELSGLPSDRGVVRLGTFPSAGVLILPRALAALRRTHPAIRVTTREASTPALVRALRARTIDLAILGSRPPHRPLDEQTPPLECLTLLDTELLLAVPAGSALAAAGVADIQALADQDWIASPSSAGEPGMGVWPSFPGRPRIAHTARDWLTKLQLVAAGCGITTVPAGMAEAVPASVRLVEVQGPVEHRRVVLARFPGPQPPAVANIVRTLRREAARQAGGADPTRAGS